VEFIKEWSDYDPKLNKSVEDFIEINKYNLPELWDSDLSEEENIDFMIDYFTKFPNEMRTSSNYDKTTKANQTKSDPLRGYVPILQNIGGVNDFKSFKH